MNNQGIFGALDQFWSVDEAPRLHRRNTYFDDHRVSNINALRFGLVVSVLATAMVVCWSMGLLA